jgi:hypothetical protein
MTFFTAFLLPSMIKAGIAAKTARLIKKNIALSSAFAVEIGPFT